MKKSVIPKIEIKLDDHQEPMLEPKTGHHLLTHPVIFMSEYKGLGILEDKNPKPICRFTPFAVMHPTYGQISKGHYVCVTKEIFDKLIKHAGMDSSYRIVKKLPRETDRMGNIIDRDTGGSGRMLNELNDEERQMYRSMTHLEAQYFTKGSGYTVFKDNIRKEETKDRVMAQINTIKAKLNLRD